MQDSDSASSKSEPKSAENIEIKSETLTTPVKENVTPLEMIFNSAKKGVTSLAEVPPPPPPVVPDVPEPEQAVELEEEKLPRPPPGLDPMTMLLQNLKKQTEEKKAENPLSTLLGDNRPVPGSESEPTVLIFGDETLRDLDESLNHSQLAYAIEVHMLEGAETKNIQKYIQETLGKGL